MREWARAVRPRAAVACAAVAIALGAGVAAAAANGRGVTLLVHMQEREPMAALVPRSFAFVQMTAHYDGVYFYAVARDPLARGRAHQLIDLAAYRYGHPGYGWMAWIASGGGRPAAVPYALLAVSLLGLGVAAAAVSVLAADHGLSPWWGLSVALNPGLLVAVSLDTSETVGLALGVLALLAWTRRRWAAAGAAIAAGCFTKEPLLLVPAAFLAWELVVVIRGGRFRLPLPGLAALGVGPLLYAGWIAYCHHVFGVLPSSEINQVGLPFRGWVDTLRQAAGFLQQGDAQVGMATTALLVAVGGLLVLGIVRALRLRGPLDLLFVALAGLALCTNWLVLLYPKDLIRTIALPLALVPFVLAGGRPSPLSAESALRGVEGRR